MEHRNVNEKINRDTGSLHENPKSICPSIYSDADLNRGRFSVRQGDDRRSACRYTRSAEVAKTRVRQRRYSFCSLCKMASGPVRESKLGGAIYEVGRFEPVPPEVDRNESRPCWFNGASAAAVYGLETREKKIIAVVPDNHHRRHRHRNGPHSSENGNERSW